MGSALPFYGTVDFYLYDWRFWRMYSRGYINVILSVIQVPRGSRQLLRLLLLLAESNEPNETSILDAVDDCENIRYRGLTYQLLTS